MKNQKIKTFVITVAKTFPIGHPRYGELTKFKEQILSGGKIHTMRLNYEYWKHKIDLVNQGKAIISLREWIGLPYKKPGQQEFKQLTQADRISIQPFTMYEDKSLFIDSCNRSLSVDYSLLAKNDGLIYADFVAWFDLGSKQIQGGIIHFTDFKY